ncbi:helix-turn-helix domain-containing protein [Streptomyces sp. NPDC006012]|uniref:helix-turn-helix domain-containing protein n=1 Tax=Streptomyces sp. NPDC006012 TaxID=3364739 RepID=UPI0036BEF4EB
MSDGTYGPDFAELLRTLKERSQLSYGVLARRLHMSTSTLHRYCNGDAVPTDYGPVERLARLCKATPEELVELHRRWVMADAVRGKKPAAPAETRPDPGESAPSTAGEAQTAPDAAEAASGAAETPSGQARPRAVEARAVEGQAVPADAAAPASRPGATAPGPDAVDAAASGPGAVDAAAPGPAAVPSGADAVENDVHNVPGDLSIARRPAPADRPRHSRRTAVLAGVAVAAVLGAVALTLNLASGGKHGDDGRSPVGAAAPDHVSAPPTSASPSPSASASKKPKPGEKTSPPVSVSATPGPTGDAPAGAGKTDAGPLLTVNTRPYTWEDPCSQHYLIDRPATDVGPPPVEQDAPAWVAAYKAVSAGEQLLTVTVQGTGADTVVLDGLKVRVVGRDAPLAWNDYAVGVGCGGNVPTRPFTVALDAARPVVVAGSGQRDFPFKVSESDPEVFRITAQASAYDVSWYLELAWSSGTRKGTLVVDDNGKPFRTSGNNGRPRYDFPIGAEKWEKPTDAS